MISLAVRSLPVAVLALALNITPAQTGRPGCYSPGANALSRVTFSKEPVTFPSSSPDQTQQPNIYPAGTKASYQCDPGYVLLGDRVRVCREGKWTKASPHCYLNVAERSSLVIDHRALADGNKTTSDFLLNLFNSKNVSIKLYLATRILQIRIIADKDLQGNDMHISLLDGTNPVFELTAKLSRSPHPQPRDEAALFIAFNDSHRDIPNATSIRLSVPALGGGNGGFRKTSGVRLYELQIVADSTGLSWRQCLDDVGPLVEPTQRNTWAFGDLCYHLVTTPPKTYPKAQARCLLIGENGTLYRPAEGLDNITIDKVREGVKGRHQTRSKSMIWIHGEDDRRKDGTSESKSCRAMSRNSTQTYTYKNCGDRHPYICQRAPRLCGSFPQKATFTYIQPEQPGHRKDDIINVTCGDSQRTPGQIQCLAPEWSRLDSCGSRLYSGGNTQAPEVAGHLGAVLGGVLGGVIVITVLSLAVIRGRNGRRQRRRQQKPVPPVDDCSDFLGLSPNPIYGSSSNDDEHLYSEVSDPEPIYEECFNTARLEPSPPPEPPPLPTTRPSASSVGDGATAAPSFLSGGPTSAPPVTFDPDYEVFPAEAADQHNSKLRSHVLKNTRPSAASDSIPAPAPPSPFDSDYEAFPCESQMTPRSAAAAKPTTDTGSVSPKLRETSRPALEYAVPLVNGRPPAGHDGNSSFTERPTDVGTDVPHFSVGEEDEYALPYRVRPPAGHDGNSSFTERPTDVGTDVPHLYVGEEDEYALPYRVRPPAGHDGNSSFTERPTDVGTDVPHLYVGEEDEYALPYRAEANRAGGRRSIPDVAMMAMMVDKAGHV